MQREGDRSEITGVTWKALAAGGFQDFQRERRMPVANAEQNAPTAAVRRALPGDAERIAAVHISSWQSAYRRQLPDDFLDHLSDELARRIEFWRTHIKDSPSAKHEIWVAEFDREPCGFVAVGPARDVDEGHIGEIYAIYVHPDRWRQGLGRTLLANATSRLAALGFSTAILWVLLSNAQARRFYELAGWCLDGKTKIETLPGGVELREVRYRIMFRVQNEEANRGS